MRPHFENKELLGAHVEWKGEHKGIKYLIGCTIREPSPFMEYNKAWCTYVLLTPEQHEKYKHVLEGAPWNCGQTYYRKHAVEHIGISPDLKAKWDGHWFRMGDDFQHYWDDGKHDLYDLNYMREHVQEVIDYIVGSAPAVERGAGEGDSDG